MEAGQAYMIEANFRLVDCIYDYVEDVSPRVVLWSDAALLPERLQLLFFPDRLRGTAHERGWIRVQNGLGFLPDACVEPYEKKLAQIRRSGMGMDLDLYFAKLW